jgi:hypothetical protein
MKSFRICEEFLRKRHLMAQESTFNESVFTHVRVLPLIWWQDPNMSRASPMPGGCLGALISAKKAPPLVNFKEISHRVFLAQPNFKLSFLLERIVSMPFAGAKRQYG